MFSFLMSKKEVRRDAVTPFAGNLGDAAIGDAA
jgi:hypothetical protein